jgi:hypothetical protein
MTVLDTLQGFPAVIYDSHNRYLIKAIITEHHKREMSIYVSELLEDVPIGERVHLLVVHSGGASEFGGIVRGTNRSEGTREISLFNEQRRTGRATLRYELKSPGIVVSHTPLATGRPEELFIRVVITNMSSAGMLVKAPPLHFAKGGILEINTEINGKEVRLAGRIVRENPAADGTIDYGCKFEFK